MEADAETPTWTGRTGEGRRKAERSARERQLEPKDHAAVVRKKQVIE